MNKPTEVTLTPEQRKNFLAIRAELAKKRKDSVARNDLSLVTQSSSKTNSALFRAAEKGDLDTALRVLASENGDINHRSTGLKIGNFTPLMIAAKNGHVNVVSAFLSLDLTKHPLDTRAQSGSAGQPRYTALHYAAKAGHDEIVAMLALVDPESALIKSHKKEEGQPLPLHCAIGNNHESTAMILLQECDPEQIFAKTTTGLNALQLAYDKGLQRVVSKIITLLLKDPKQYKVELENFKKHLSKTKAHAGKYLGLLYHNGNEFIGEALLSKLDRASAAELILLYDITKYMETTKKESICTEFEAMRKVVFEDRNKIYDGLVEYNTQQPLPLSFNCVSQREKVTIGRELFKLCVIGSIDYKINIVDSGKSTWIQGHGFADGLFEALRFSAVPSMNKSSQANAMFFKPPALSKEIDVFIDSIVAEHFKDDAVRAVLAL